MNLYTKQKWLIDGENKGHQRGKGRGRDKLGAQGLQIQTTIQEIDDKKGLLYSSRELYSIFSSEIMEFGIFSISFFNACVMPLFFSMIILYSFPIVTTLAPIFKKRKFSLVTQFPLCYMFYIGIF